MKLLTVAVLWINSYSLFLRLPIAERDHQEPEIWRIASASPEDEVLTVLGPHSLTASDYLSLKGRNYVGDQVSANDGFTVRVYGPAEEVDCTVI
jgi:hypothetical protein